MTERNDRVEKIIVGTKKSTEAIMKELFNGNPTLQPRGWSAGRAST